MAPIVEVTTPVAATLLGVTYEHFKTVLATEEVPHLERGSKGNPWKFHMPTLIGWWLKRELDKAPNQRGRTLSLNDARQKKTAAEAELAELELAKAKADVIPTEIVTAVLARTLTAARGRLLAIPAKAGPLVCMQEPHAARETLEKMIREVLEELSQDVVGLASGGSEGSGKAVA